MPGCLVAGHEAGHGRARTRSVIVEVDAAGPMPPYEQIRAQLATMIAAGALSSGERLPTVRQLAADLGLAVNTVARAYRELEAAGLVISRVRHGTTVADRPPTLSPAEKRRRLADAARAYLVAASQLGVPAGEAEQAVREQSSGQSGPGRTGAPGLGAQQATVRQAICCQST